MIFIKIIRFLVIWNLKNGWLVVSKCVTYFSIYVFSSSLFLFVSLNSKRSFLLQVWHKFLYELKNATYAIELWHSAIKSVQGQFGSGVASYFIFLRFLVYLNFSNLILTGAFLLIPQLVYDMSSKNISNKTAEAFSGFDLLTGSVS